MLKANKKNRAKSHKDKTRNSAAISVPATTIVRQPGLYMKLISHQKNIATQLKFITTALEDNGHSQYRSRHKKMDLTAVVTALLVQLDNAVTTTHQCLTKDIVDKDENIKPELEKYEKGLYVGVAFIVRWIDFDSKGAGREMPENREKMTTTIKEFEVSLAEVVRLVYQCQIQDGSVSSSPSNHQRRSSIDSGTINAAQRQNSAGGESLGSPVVGGNMDDLVHRGHPAVEHLRSEKSRKSSWAPVSNSPIGNLFRNKVNTLMPTTNPRDSGLSEGSSGGASDEERRRSGSSDQNQSGGQSPEHSVSNRNSMSSDWEGSRVRTLSTPYERENGGAAVPIPISTPVVPSSTSLPPLPGEDYNTPPPPPKRFEEDLRSRTLPVPKKKGFSSPRAVGGLQLNGHISPDLSSSNHPYTATDEVDGDEVPPPVPIKKRYTSNASTPLAETYPTHAHSSSIDEDAPPPVPVKVRRGTNNSNQRGSVSSPNTTPTHGSYRPINAQVQPDGIVLGVGGKFPPVPLRMESIPGVKTALGQETPPPKPPRNDRPNSAELLSPVHSRPSSLVGQQGREAIHVFNTIRRYNEDIRKAKENGPDAAPPLPLKKKTVMMYKGLVQGYTYDESIMQPLYIPGMEAPPPIPPKKRKKQKSSKQALTNLSDPSSSALNQSSTSQKLDQSSEDLEEGGEVNYLECEEATGYLVFNKEETGGYTLKGGPVDALIAYAASSAKSVMHFSEAFLLTYYTFITPGELISKLLYRLTYFYRSNTQAIWQATTSLLVRALTVLKQPLSKESQVELIDLVHLMITDGNLKFAQLLRTALVDKLNQLMTENTAPALGESFIGNVQRKQSIMDYSAESIARQMTILDNQLFQRVDVCEMLYWAKEQSEEKSPMLTLFTLHFNNVSQWTKATLLKRGLDMKNRCKLMLHFIAIMKSLLETFNNFNSYLAILSAIEAAPISRLDWNDKILKGLEEPRQLIDNRGSFKNYREAFAQAKPPCIPYIGLYLQDLTFIEMQPSKLAEDPSAINFTKRWKQFKSVDHIRFAQTKQYTFKADPELLNLFKNFEVKETDEELWSISTEIKPSNRTMRTANQS